MDVDGARETLGVGPQDSWARVRATYRNEIRRVHPDIVGASGTDRSATLNAAFRVLAIARREGRLGGVPVHDTPVDGTAVDGTAVDDAGGSRETARPWPPASVLAADVGILGGDTLVLHSTPEESFRRLVEATHAIGEVSYIDRSSAIFEAVLTLRDGTPASFVVSLQWRAHDATCEAFCTLEALDRSEHLDVTGVLEQLVRHLPPDREN